MQNHYLLTPYFIDEPVPQLGLLGGPQWQLNRPGELKGDTTQQRLISLYEGIVDFVADTAAAGERPVSVAGDCITTHAVLTGLQRAGISPILVWFDAHGDFNTWETSPSGFLGGMPLAMLVGRGEQTIANALGMKSQPENRVLLTDARDLDPEERKAVQSSDVRHVAEIDDLQWPDEWAGAPVYVHFDCDVVNPDEVPAVPYPASGGPSADTVRQVLRRLARDTNLVAVSLSAWDPNMGGAEQSEEVVMGLLGELVGT
jgi:arginase